MTRRMLPLGATLIVAAVLCAGCGKSSHDDAQATPSSGARVVPVEAARATQTDLTVIRQFSGSLEGEEQANLIAKVSERVTALHVRVGDNVRAGQTLVGLDRTGTSSQYLQAEANYRNAEKNLERMKSLFAEGAVAAQTLDGAQTSFDVAKANFEAARSIVDLTTPINGAVTAVNVNLGDLTTPGQVLATVANIGRMKVTFSLNEVDMLNVVQGQKVTAYSEARPDRKVEGHISQISKSADVRSRSFEIKALFPNTADHWFKPGMYVRVTINVSPHHATLVIPAAAIQSDGSTSKVFVIKGGSAASRQVAVGVSDGAQTEILSGLAPGDSVATVGVNNLTDGSSVTVVSR